MFFAPFARPFIEAGNLTDGTKTEPGDLGTLACRGTEGLSPRVEPRARTARKAFCALRALQDRQHAAHHSSQQPSRDRVRERDPVDVGPVSLLPRCVTVALHPRPGRGVSAGPRVWRKREALSAAATLLSALERLARSVPAASSLLGLEVHLPETSQHLQAEHLEPARAHTAEMARERRIRHPRQELSHRSKGPPERHALERPDRQRGRAAHGGPAPRAGHL